jgi:hypothetical protein
LSPLLSAGLALIRAIDAARIIENKQCEVEVDASFRRGALAFGFVPFKIRDLV